MILELKCPFFHLMRLYMCTIYVSDVLFYVLKHLHESKEQTTIERKIIIYRNDPKCSDRHTLANSADQDQTTWFALPSTPFGHIFLCWNFRVITSLQQIFPVSNNLELVWYPTFSNHSRTSIFFMFESHLARGPSGRGST